MRRISPPEMICRPLPRFDLDDWPAIQRIFEPLPAWEFRQAWRSTPSRLMRGGRVRAGTRPGRLVVYAELCDDDIFNPVTLFNAFAYTRGDAFEMFLRPEGQEAYYEFHVSPRNQQLQLRFESGKAFRALGKSSEKNAIDACKVSKPLFESRTRVRRALRRWFVIAVIPFGSVMETEGPSASSCWHFSASRYDYTRGKRQPVVSSTSAHAICDFHRQPDWGTLRFGVSAKG